MALQTPVHATQRNFQVDIHISRLPDIKNLTMLRGCFGHKKTSNHLPLDKRHARYQSWAIHGFKLMKSASISQPSNNLHR